MFKRADRGTAEIQASFFQYPTAALSRPSPALVALSVVAAVALPAVAGAKPSKKKIRKAARLDKVGKSLYANKRFSEAVVAFEEAFDTDPKAKYLFNLAKAHDKNGNLPEAIDAYERYVDRAPNAQDAEDIRAVLTFLQTKLNRQRGQVEISCRPAAAQVLLTADGEKVTGTTPFSEWVEPAGYTLQVTRKGYEPFERTVNVTKGSATKIEVVLDKVAAAPPPRRAAKKRTKTAPVVEAAKEEAVPAEPPPPAGDTGGGPGLATWASFGVAGAALIAGVVLGGAATAKGQEYNDYVSGGRSDGNTRTHANALADESDSLALMANVAYGLALVAAGTGGVLAFTAAGPRQGLLSWRTTW